MLKQNDAKKQRSRTFNEMFFDNETLSLWTYEKLVKLNNQNLNQIAGSANNLVWYFKKNESLGSRKERLLHEAGLVNWMKNVAC